MTAAIAVRKKEHEVVRPPAVLIPVIYKRKRVDHTNPNEGAMLNFHTFKCFAGVLNPAAVHGHGFYVRRITGQNVESLMSQMDTIIKGQKEAVNDR